MHNHNLASNRSSAIAENLLNISDCAKNYSDTHFSIISKTCNDYHLSVLESLFIKTFKSNLCKQQCVCKSNLYLLWLFFGAYFLYRVATLPGNLEKLGIWQFRQKKNWNFNMLSSKISTWLKNSIIQIKNCVIIKIFSIKKPI